ncbi:HAD family hydrolase [soil metagenome]
MPGSILFDLDGTLTDAKPGITGCIRHSLRALGVDPPSPDELAWCLGPPLHHAFPKLLGTEDPATVQRAMELYRERFTEVGLYENAVYEGIPETLTQLRAMGYRLFVATSKPHVYARRILDHFEIAEPFKGIYGSELDGTRCGKADLIAHILATESLDPSETIMVGDRKHDMIGATACGIRGIGVLYGYGSREELLTAGATALCENPRELPDAVSGLPETE